MSDNPLFDTVPSRAVRILRAKAAELEARALLLFDEGDGEAANVIADIALIASILAEYIDATS